MVCTTKINLNQITKIIRTKNSRGTELLLIRQNTILINTDQHDLRQIEI